MPCASPSDWAESLPCVTLLLLHCNEAKTSTGAADALKATYVPLRAAELPELLSSMRKNATTAIHTVACPFKAVAKLGAKQSRVTPTRGVPAVRVDDMRPTHAQVCACIVLLRTSGALPGTYCFGRRLMWARTRAAAAAGTDSSQQLDQASAVAAAANAAAARFWLHLADFVYTNPGGPAAWQRLVGAMGQGHPFLHFRGGNLCASLPEGEVVQGGGQGWEGTEGRDGFSDYRVTAGEAAAGGGLGRVFTPR